MARLPRVPAPGPYRVINGLQAARKLVGGNPEGAAQSFDPPVPAPIPGVARTQALRTLARTLIVDSIVGIGQVLLIAGNKPLRGMLFVQNKAPTGGDSIFVYTGGQPVAGQGFEITPKGYLSYDTSVPPEQVWVSTLATASAAVKFVMQEG